MFVFLNEVTVGALHELLTAGTWLTANDSETALDVGRHFRVSLMDVAPESTSLLYCRLDCVRGNRPVRI